jgi:hypothetical protein
VRYELNLYILFGRTSGFNVSYPFRVNQYLLLNANNLECHMCPCAAECTAHVLLDGDVEERNGYKFPKFNSLKIVFTVGTGTVQLRNLFGGDKVLGKYH